MLGTTTTKNDSQPTDSVAEAPLIVFSESLALISDRAIVAMEKAIRNLANPLDANVGSLKNEKSRGFDDKDFLRDGNDGLRNFAKRDAADLFTAPALANDKDGKLTEREMSLPSAFYSRGGHDDSAHPAVELSDSEDADVNHRANRSMTVSGPLGSERSLGSESETERDSTIFLGNCATEDLDLVENAILRLLREDVRLSSKEHREDSTKLKDALGMDEHLEGSEGDSVHTGAGTVDLQLLSRLLDQVQSLRDQKHQHRQIGRAARSISRSGRSVWDLTKRNSGKERKLSKDDLKKAVEAATQAAKSAAEAAKSAATLVTKNSDAVTKLVQSLNPSSKSHPKKKERGKHRHSSSSSSSDSSSDSEESSKAIAKKIVSQNRYTHVVLGIMLVSSFVWRYIVVKAAKRVRSKVSDPWGYVGGTLSDGFKGPEKEKEKEKAGKGEATPESSSGLSLPQLTLPPLLQGVQRPTETEAPTPSDGDGEERNLSIGNILQIKPSSDNS